MMLSHMVPGSGAASSRRGEPPSELSQSHRACTVWAPGDPEESKARLGSMFIS